MNLTRGDIIFLALAIAALSAVMIFAVPSDPFDYDPADYMYAASRGFAANYTDADAIPLLTFLKMGMESGKDPAKKAALSQFIRESGDISLHRHFHAPLSIYYLVFAKHLVGDSEYAMRWATLLLHLLCGIVVYAGCRALSSEGSPIPAVAGALFYLTSAVNLESALKVSPHSLHVLLVVATLVLLSHALRTGSLRSWYFSVAALCGAMLTYEYALFLLAVFVAVAFLRGNILFPGKEKGERRKILLMSIGLFLLIFFLLWPAGIYKLTVAKNYIFIAYFALVRRESVSTEGPFAVWGERFARSPVEFILLAAAIGLLIHAFFIRRSHPWLLPFVLYVGVMLLVSAGNSLPSPTYVSSLFGALYVPAGILLGEWIARQSSQRRTVLFGALCVLILGNNAYHYAHRPPDPDLAQRNAVIAYLRAESPVGIAILVPKEFFPSAHYYFRGSDVEGYYPSEGPAGFAAQAEERSYGIVIYRGAEDRALTEKMRSGGYETRAELYRSPDGREIIAAYRKPW